MSGQPWPAGCVRYWYWLQYGIKQNCIAMWAVSFPSVSALAPFFWTNAQVLGVLERWESCCDTRAQNKNRRNNWFRRLYILVQIDFRGHAMSECLQYSFFLHSHARLKHVALCISESSISIPNGSQSLPTLFWTPVQTLIWSFSSGAPRLPRWTQPYLSNTLSP